MKLLFAVFVLFCSSAGWSADQPLPAAPAAVLKGEVLEVRNVESYTYLRLKTGEGEIWAAVGKAPLKKGAKVTIEDVTVMHNFQSKALNKTFEKISFGSLAGPAGQMAVAHGNVPRTEVAAGDIKVAKASGPDARSVAEVTTKSAELKDKPVVVRGKVVKFTAAVMGKNWIHLRDGSGSAADKSDDLLVTTMDKANIGDTVLVKGVVHTNKDFGAGYSYKVLIEEATLGQ